MDEQAKKYVLLDILEQSYTDDNTGEKKPYYDIYIKDLAQNRVMRLRALNNAVFSNKLPTLMSLVGKAVNPVFGQKLSKAGVWVSVVEDILP